MFASVSVATPHSQSFSSPLMEEAEAGAVEGWVTTGSRRLSKETKELGLIPDWSRVVSLDFRGVLVVCT